MCFSHAPKIFVEIETHSGVSLFLFRYVVSQVKIPIKHGRFAPQPAVQMSIDYERSFKNSLKKGSEIKYSLSILSITPSLVRPLTARCSVAALGKLFALL